VEVTRRSAVALSVAGLLASAAPAQAFLGFGDDNALFEKYTTTTVGYLNDLTPTPQHHADCAGPAIL
jgi:hypothetical protein